jgi:hypothetical protein
MMAVIFAHKPQTSRTNPLPVGDSGGAVTFKDRLWCLIIWAFAWLIIQQGNSLVNLLL